MSDKKEKQEKEYGEDDYGWDDVSKMTPEQIKEELLEQRKRFEQMDRDLFKSNTATRRLQAQVKQLQELNSAHGVTHNNTSSAFTLPSEFKKLWDELVTELILDAFPDFLEHYKLFVCLVQELFIVVRQLILDTREQMVLKIAKDLQLITDSTDLNSNETKQATIMLHQKLQCVFKDFSTQIFSYSKEQIKDFIESKYKPRCEAILEDEGNEDDTKDMFEDNVGTPDFIRFVQAIVKLQLHMVLNDPPIELSMLSCEQRLTKSELVERYEFWMFNKNDYYCIDGFPREGYPCVVVLPPPYRQGYVYQGIKPAVIVLSDTKQDEMLMEHVHEKQQAVLDKLKQKRASSLAAVQETNQAAKDDPKETDTINVKKVVIPKTTTTTTKNNEEEQKKAKDQDTSQVESQTEQVFEPVPDKIIGKNEDSEKSKPEHELQKSAISPPALSDADETNIRESGPLESNEPKESSIKVDLEQDPSLSLTNRNSDIVAEMIELPHEIIKSSRIKTMDVNLPPKATMTLGTARKTTTNNNTARELSSPSPQFQLRKVDRRPGESEDDESQQVPQMPTTQLSPGGMEEAEDEPAPLPSESPEKKITERSRVTNTEDQNDEIEDNDNVANSYTLRLEQTDKTTSRQLDFSDSHQYSVASPEGSVQEIQGGYHANNIDEVRANFERQRRNLADNLKEAISKSTVVDRDSLYYKNNGNQKQNETGHPSQLAQSSNLTGGFEELRVTRGPYDPKQNAFYEMPKAVHDMADDETDNVENINSSANKLSTRQRISSPAKHSHGKTSNSPYFQSSSKFSMQAARNTVNASTSSISNVYKRDRSSSNNVRRPPMPSSQQQQQQLQHQQQHNASGGQLLFVSTLGAASGARQSTTLQHQLVPNTIESLDGGNSNHQSIIAEMHYQKGMSDIKQDLQRKIVSYQTILKKTYAQAEREKQTKKKVVGGKSKERETSQNGGRDTPSSFLVNQKRKAQGSSTRSAALEQRCQPSKTHLSKNQLQQQQLRADKSRKNCSKDKVESLDQLKSAYFAKMQSLTKKLDSERVIGRNQSQRKEESNSRSKSPLQAGRNMPRQMPGTMVKDVYVPSAAQLNINRKSLSRGRANNPQVGKQQVSIKQSSNIRTQNNSGSAFLQLDRSKDKVAQTIVSTTRNHIANQRNSIYLSSDSSDEVIQGEVRRSSAPINQDPSDTSYQHTNTAGYSSRPQKRETPQQAYVFTSDDSAGADDSDSDSDDSVDVNARADVYQPASHLRKAVVMAKQTSKAAKTTSKPVSQNKQQLYSNIRTTSGTRKENATVKHQRNQSKSSTRAKHGIQTIQNRTAAFERQRLSQPQNRGGERNSAHRITYSQLNGQQIHPVIFNSNSSEKQSISFTHQSGTAYIPANNNRTVHQISNKSLGNTTVVAKDRYVGLSSPQQTSTQQTTNKQRNLYTHDHHGQQRNLIHQQQQQQQQQNTPQTPLGSTGTNRSQANIMIGQAAAAQGYHPIYNLRSQAQINMLENHRMAESSNTSAYERVINPVNEHHLYVHQHQMPKGQAPMNVYGPGGDARNRHTSATLINNYV